MNLHYRDISKNLQGHITKYWVIRSSEESLKQFSFQSPPKSLQRLRRCYRWRKIVPGAHSGNSKGAVQCLSTINAAIKADRSCLWGSKSVIGHRVKLGQSIMMTHSQLP